MDFSIDDYIKETIDHSLGLPISMDTLQKKLYTTEESNRRLREQYQSLVSKLNEKDRVIELVRSESKMNAQALKKFVKKNQNLVSDREDLVKQCKMWENECIMYEKDRESLMDFCDETEVRAREAESRVCELEEEVKKKSESEEDLLLESVLADETVLMDPIYLEVNQSCQALLNNWDDLKPLTQKVVSLVSMVKRIEKEKECLIMNLVKAEKEVELVSEQNRELERENRKLLKQCSVDRSHGSSSSTKRKSCKLLSSPIEKKIDLSSQKGFDA